MSDNEVVAYMRARARRQLQWVLGILAVACIAAVVVWQVHVASVERKREQCEVDVMADSIAGRTRTDWTC